ncbi:uncharacterized protein LOC114440380 [Parambassis ranga]|uniref:Uncharacterized protein LOC114440380 n=1 Tax=Parambassis ranga TaxID=210632 RepID=A0A6P7IXN5_9TELE|nr:uncharacterized protein LOC114440380 [Parambassis ranga]
MDVFEEQLAEAVRRYEHLYNTSLRTYKDTQMANNSWKEIAAVLCKEESVCRKKWRHLRDRFAKAKRRVHNCKSGDPGGQKFPVVYTALQWLEPHVKHRETSTNLDLDTLDEQSVADPEEGGSCTTDVCSIAELEYTVLDAAPPVASTPLHGRTVPLPATPPSPRRTGRKRMRGNQTCLDFEGALEILDKRRAEREELMQAGRRDAVQQLMDPCARYMLHVTDFMRALPPQALRNFKWQLQNLMHKTEQEVEQGNAAIEMLS